MLKKILANLKWMLMLYSVLSAFAIMTSAFAIWYFAHTNPAFTAMHLWGLFALTAVVISLTTGYMIAKLIQRNLDPIQLGMMQLTKGNLSIRLPIDEHPAFELMYEEFNEMSEAIEDKLKLLQALGEEQVALQSETIETAVLEERKRLARDLHDSVSQQLFAIHMSASSLPKLQEVDGERAEEVLSQLVHMSFLAQKQMRGFISQLRPIELNGKSLSAAVEHWFPDYCRQNGLQGKLDIELQHELSEAKEHQLFFIIQEGVANVVKHASAKHVTLSLHETESQFVLHITDDGQGFDTSTKKQSSYGLTTMKERAMKLGGDLQVMSRAGKGTRIIVSIPYFKA